MQHARNATTAIPPNTMPMIKLDDSDDGDDGGDDGESGGNGGGDGDGEVASIKNTSGIIYIYTYKNHTSIFRVLLSSHTKLPNTIPDSDGSDDGDDGGSGDDGGGGDDKVASIKNTSGIIYIYIYKNHNILNR